MASPLVVVAKAVAAAALVDILFVELRAARFCRWCLGVRSTSDGLLHQVLLVGIWLHADH